MRRAQLPSGLSRRSQAQKRCRRRFEFWLVWLTDEVQRRVKEDPDDVDEVPVFNRGLNALVLFS